ncbi:hypothetical protein [Litchfieldia alkalitelluris]|uniref:hypothetical protein n=1 Tax=Litchfieldia alkalitelluris TaxID=304268 RepID=UPI000997453A|nr:hypothetical protein [Litchfieldia alkalitelluris]
MFQKNEETDINVLHDQGLIDHFTRGIGERVFVLTPSFPFMFVGTIVDVVTDIVVIEVEVTQFPQLEERTWYIHIHNIEVFYIEREGEPKIPELNDLG